MRHINLFILFIVLVLVSSANIYSIEDDVITEDDEEIIIEAQDDEFREKSYDEDSEEIKYKKDNKKEGPRKNIKKITETELEKKLEKIINRSLKKYKDELAKEIRQDIKKEILELLNKEIIKKRKLRKKYKRKSKKRKTTYVKIKNINIGSDLPRGEVVGKGKKLKIEMKIISSNICKGKLKVFAKDLRTGKFFLIHTSKYFKLKKNYANYKINWNGTYYKRKKYRKLPVGIYKIYCKLIYQKVRSKRFAKTARFWGSTALNYYYITVVK
jgi:hypothetical protein